MVDKLKKLIALLLCSVSKFACATIYLAFTYSATTTTTTTTTSTLPQLAVAFVGNGGGTITSSPTGINCVNGTGTCSYAFTPGTSVTLTATPASSTSSSTVHGAGTELYTWGGTTCIGSSSTCSYTFTTSTNETAQFTPKDSDVWWIAPGGSDSNNGRSRKTPFATLNHVLPLMAAGDTLWFDDGTYSGQSLGGNGGTYSTNLVSGTAVKSTRYYGYTRSGCAPNCISGTASATIDGTYTKLSAYVWRGSNMEFAYLRLIHSAGEPFGIDGSTNGSGASLTVNCSGGAVSTITVSAGGSGYSASSSWPGAIWGGGVTGAQFTVSTSSGGAVNAATVVLGGSGCAAGTYASADMRVSNIWIHDVGAGWALPGSSGSNLSGIDGGECNGCTFERNWVWGYGTRYQATMYAGVNNVMRQNIVRYDGSPDGQPRAGVSIYDQDHSIAENNVVLDFTSDTDTVDGSANVHSSFFATCSATQTKYPYGLGTIGVYGNIAINTVSGTTGVFNIDSNCSMYSDPVGSNVPVVTLANNVVAGASGTTGAAFLFNGDNTASTRGSHHTAILTNNTGYGVTSTSYGVWAYGSSNWPTLTMQNNVISNTSSSGVACLRDDGSTGRTVAYNTCHNFTGTFDGDANLLTTDPTFSFLERIESGTPGYGTGLSGANRGATVVNQYQNGTLTGTVLWPFPNEAVAKDDLCAGPDTHSAATCETANNTTCTIYDRGHQSTGFCASGLSVTKYIWQQLGNPSPY